MKKSILLLFCLIMSNDSKTMNPYQKSQQRAISLKKFNSRDILKPHPLSSDVVKIVAPYCLNHKQMWYEEFCFKHKKPVVGACFILNDNAICSATEKELYAWDIALKKLKNRSDDTVEDISKIYFNKNSKKLFVQAWSDRVVLVSSELAKKREKCDSDKSHVAVIGIIKPNKKREHILYSVGCNEEGNLLATGIKNAVHVWDISNDMTKLVRIIPHKGHVISVSFDKTAEHLVTCSHANEVKRSRDVLTLGFDRHYTTSIWNVAKGKCLLSIDHESQVRDACLNTAGTLLVTESGNVFDKYIMVWNAKTGDRLKEFKYSFSHIINFLFNRAETQLIIVLAYGYVWVWDMLTDDYFLKIKTGQDCQYAQLNENGTELIAVSKSGIVSIWDMITGAHKATMNHCQPIVSPSEFGEYMAQWNQNETQVLATYNKTVRLWQRYDNFTFAQLWLLHRLHTWCLLQKPDSTVKSRQLLLAHVAKDMRYRYSRLSEIWKTFPQFVRRTIWRNIAYIVNKYGKKK